MKHSVLFAFLSISKPSNIMKRYRFLTLVSETDRQFLIKKKNPHHT